jgi:hypothetical protein
VPGRDDPGLVPKKGARAEGAVVSGLHAKDHRRLLWFEGKEYRLAAALVAAPSGRLCRALVFFLAAPLPSSHREWRFDAWPRRDRLACAARAKRLMASLSSQQPFPHRHRGFAGRVPAGGRT